MATFTFTESAKFGVDSNNTIPSVNLSGKNALATVTQGSTTQTTTTTTASNTPSKTGGVEMYRYPRQALTESSDYLMLTVVNFVKPKIGFTAGENLTFETQSKAQEGNQQIVGQVILPMPQSIIDRSSADWGSSDLNPLEAAGLAATLGAASSKNILSGTKGAIKSLITEALGQALDDKVIENLQSAMAGSVVNFAGGNVDIKKVLARTTGSVLNPNQELLFNGPTLRSFDFVFDFTPRYSEEGLEIMRMIRFLKRSMVAKGTSGLFLKAPDLFKIKYMSGKYDHPFLHRFKVCALTNLAVNYTGSNTYSTYDDGTPIHINIGMTFSEINPIYAEDYDNENFNGVGY